MKALTLKDKYTEEIIGTVLLKNGVSFNTIINAWEEYQMYNNTNTDNQPDIYDFVSKGNWDFCEVLELKEYLA